MPDKENRQTAVVVEKTYDFLLWLLPKVEKFPRSFRFTVGDRMEAVALDLLLALVEASYSAEKGALLDTANRKANGLRYLLRLSKDLKLLTLDSYGFAAQRLEEVGRMIGGWQKSQVQSESQQSKHNWVKNHLPPKKFALQPQCGLQSLCSVGELS